MLHSFYEVLGRSSPAALVIISIALMLACGFAMTRITKLLHLPNVTAYIITGVLMGPYCLNLIPHQVIAGTDFLADIALAFIAFSVGEYVRLSALRKNGPKVILIMLIEATVCTVLVFVLTYYLLRLHMAYAIVLAALASATAPTTMIVIIRQSHAKGDFVDTLLLSQKLLSMPHHRLQDLPREAEVRAGKPQGKIAVFPDQGKNRNQNQSNQQNNGGFPKRY